MGRSWNGSVRPVAGTDSSAARHASPLRVELLLGERPLSMHEDAEGGVTDPPPGYAGHSLRRGKKGEARFPPALAVVVAIVLYAPSGFAAIRAASSHPCS